MLVPTSELVPSHFSRLSVELYWSFRTNTCCSLVMQASCALEDLRVKLLIVHRTQFGYHPNYYYCVHGRQDASITYLGFWKDRPRIMLDGVNVVDVSPCPSRCVRYLRYLYAVWQEIHKGYDVVFMRYFPGCSLLRLLSPGANLVLDIRSGAVNGCKSRRLCSDVLQAMESRVFRHVVVLSAGLAKKLHLSMHKTHILPLGGEPRPLRQKSRERLDLLYVGTLNNRDIHKTIIGLSLFSQCLGREIGLSYTIVGRGRPDVEQHLRALVDELGLDDIVELVGYVHHRDLQPYYDRCNIGVSFVPINDVFDVQPSTKTFEFLLAGMPVLATATSEHKSIITASNGVLIDDTPESFCDGLAEMYQRLAEYRPSTVQETARAFTWSNVVRNNMIPFLQSIVSMPEQAHSPNAARVDENIPPGSL